MEVYSGIEEPRGPKLWREKVLYLDIRAGEPEFPVTPLLMGPVCVIGQGRLEDPVCT